MFNGIASLFVTFREGFEAVLLTVLMLGVTRAQGLHLKALAAGILGGLAGSAALAVALMQFEWLGREFTVFLNLLTALTLTYVVIWNARISKHINEHVREIRQHGFWAMLLVITNIYFREGMEVVLMLYGPVSEDPVNAAIGIGIGIAAVVLVAWLFLSKVMPRVQMSRLFMWSNVLLGLLAAFFYYEVAEFLLDL